MFYAVINGNEGDVYDSWEKCKAAIDKFSGALHRQFQTPELAWNWICQTMDPLRAHMEQDVNNEPNLPVAEGSGSNLASTDAIELSKEQNEVVAMCERGKSVFFTGSAGTGKSVCLRHIIRRLREQHGDSVFVTASTGIAAINVGGVTLHSFAGIGLGREPVNKLYENIKNNRAPRERWLSATTLIIDEISMIDGRLFDKLEQLARMIRQVELPFGGIQLIVCGDFFQLPPVPDSLGSGQKIPVKFAFEAESWDTSVPNMIVLQTVFRQKDADLIDMLNMMRLGEIDPLGLALFKRLEKDVVYDDDIKPTELLPRRYQVDQANTARLNALPGDLMTFYANDIPGYDMNKVAIKPERASKLLDETLAPRELKLRVGAQVMLTKNMGEKSLVNGSLGTVISFDTNRDAMSHHVPLARAEGGAPDDEGLAAITQVVEPGSPTQRKERHAEFKDISSGMNREEARDPPKPRDGPRWPVVRFTNGEVRQIVAANFEAVNGIGGVEATRQQVPLILAWALSVHKSQGQTIERVKVNLQGVFEKGQAYVAVSRATSIKSLQVLNFHPERVMAHQRVLDWSQTIEGMKKSASVIQQLPPDEEMYWDDSD